MIQKLVNDLIDQFIIELKKQETFDRIQNTILEPISRYVKSKTHPYINLLLFIIVLYSITQPIILFVLFKQNKLIMSTLKQLSNPVCNSI
jgi:hypothetical protein